MDREQLEAAVWRALARRDAERPTSASPLGVDLEFVTTVMRAASDHAQHTAGPIVAARRSVLEATR